MGTAKFRETRDSFSKELFGIFPTQATSMGVHDYDHLLESFSKEAREEASGKLAKLERLQRTVNHSNLSPEEKTDLGLMKAELYLQRFFFDEFRHWESDPGLYPELALQAIYYLLSKNGADRKAREEAIHSRLKQIPRLLNEALENLKNPPAIFCDVGIEIVDGGIEFFQSLKPAGLATSTKSKREIEKQIFSILDALESYKKWIRGPLKRRAKGSFSAGKELFDGLLQRFHLLPYDAKDLKAIGLENFDRTLKALEKLSRKIAPGKDWKEILLENSQRHPSSRQLVPTYARVMEKARAFVQEKNLVPLPRHESIRVNETPPFYRSFLPFAAYMPPPAFQAKGDAELWVTPIPQKLSERETAVRLKEHAFHKIPVIVLHETYPGHHVQFAFLQQLDSPLVKRAFASCEGWALYCEEMMCEEGFYSKVGKSAHEGHLIELSQRRDELWRVARVILDVGLHTERMKPENAAKFLSDNVQMPLAMAWGEVKRYVREPAQPMSYFIGKMEILKLRQAYRKKFGAKFKLYNFHEALLECGPVPIKLARERMLAG